MPAVLRRITEGIPEKSGCDATELNGNAVKGPLKFLSVFYYL